MNMFEHTINSWNFPYASQRMPVFAANVVSTSQPLATQAGVDIMRRGGNAVDAALATAITLTVVEPTSNGLGSDAFAMVYKDGQLSGLNSSGRSPQACSFEQYAHYNEMPTLGWPSVTVPGAVALWQTLSERFGRLPFAQLFDAAIHYARDGFAVSPITATAWCDAAARYEAFDEFNRVFMPNGRPPKPGQHFSNPGLAMSLEKIAATGGRDFYHGDLAARMADCAAEAGAALSTQDLANHRADWVQPLAIDYYGVTLHELPPNGQGLAALVALRLLQQLGIHDYPCDSVDSLHLQIECMKLALDAVARYVSDPATMQLSAQDLLSDAAIHHHAAGINLHRAQTLGYTLPVEHGTVYLSSADQDGTMVSLIQSNYMGFGSGIVIPGTGISMQNRGCGFSLQAGHPNQFDGAKRPLHTIIPGFVSVNGRPLMSFGVMGGRMQPQGHVQMMVRIFNYRQNPQTASDAPRWCVLEDGRIALEAHMPQALIRGLLERGHVVANDASRGTFGGAQIIVKHKHSYIAASDHRKDGMAAGF